MKTAAGRAVRVECHSGHRADETPRRFVVGGRTVEVVEVLDRGQAPDHRSFRVRGDDGGVYVLRHDTDADLWDLHAEARAARRT
jgi:hypothetical protein